MDPRSLQWLIQPSSHPLSPPLYCPVEAQAALQYSMTGSECLLKRAKTLSAKYVRPQNLYTLLTRGTTLSLNTLQEFSVKVCKAVVKNRGPAA